MPTCEKSLGPALRLETMSDDYSCVERTPPESGIAEEPDDTRPRTDGGRKPSEQTAEKNNGGVDVGRQQRHRGGRHRALTSA